MKKRTKRQIEAVVKTLQRQCGLEMWSFDVVIEKDTPESKRKDIGAYIDVNLEYRRGTIHFYEDQLTIAKSGLIQNLRHELIHCIVAMREEAKVEHINNLISRYEDELKAMRARLRRAHSNKG